MCGICGIIDRKNHLTPERRNDFVAKMNQAIEHRGPDGEGNFRDEICALSMRRLAIIDLTTGDQPIYNETRDVLVFFNGMIYNYRTLRADLIEKGHVFKTECDTEVLVHLYEEFGEAMFLKLKGMFAFCIYDLKKKTFLLARDRFGEKPLFYYWNDQVLSFSSEVKSLLENKNIPRKLNQNALPYYFRTSLIPEPITLLEGVKILPAGHYLKVDSEGFELKKYFHLTYKVDSNIKTVEDAEALIRPNLESAVKRQTQSDVPIGAFLSGGIDSSTVVALMQKNATEKIKTFNVRFEDEAYDESPIARKVAEFWDTDHHEITVPNYDFKEDIFWKIIDHVGLPFRDSSAIPTYFISEQIRKHVTVALSGDGGDELFGGYDLFQWYQKILGFQRIPRPVRSLGNQSLNMLTQLPFTQNISKLRQIKRGLRTSLESEKDIPIALNQFFELDEIRQFLNIPNGHSGNSHRSNGGLTQVPNPPFQRWDINLNLLKKYPPESKNWSSLRNIMYYRTRHTLPANMLVKVDRMSMANSLEVRAPFLDADLFNVAAQLPDKFLINKGLKKFMIHKIMANDLPPEVFNHPKKGFGIPLYKYQNTAFKSLAKRLLFEENPLPNLFPKSFLEATFHEGLNHKKNTANRSVFQSAHRLWMLMMLFGWAKRFGVSY